MSESLLKTLAVVGAELLRHAADRVEASSDVIAEKANEFLTGEHRESGGGAVCPVCGRTFPLPEDHNPAGWVCQPCARILGWDGRTHIVRCAFRVAGTESVKP